MRYIHHLIDDLKFEFVSDVGEIGRYEPIEFVFIQDYLEFGHYELSRSLSLVKGGHQRGLKLSEGVM
jgi:hypothetical protein